METFLVSKQKNIIHTGRVDECRKIMIIYVFLDTYKFFEIKFIKLICWCVRSILYQYWYKIGLVLYITMQKIVLYWFNLLNIIDKIFILSYQLCQLKINSWREYFLSYQVSNSLVTEFYNSCLIVVAACGIVQKIKNYWFPNQERVI